MTVYIQQAIILGGSSLVADYLLPRLAGRFDQVAVVARRPVAVPPGVVFSSLDAFRADDRTMPPRAVVFSLMPLTALITHLPALRASQAIVALSSTRRFSNLTSPDPVERAGAEALVTAEADFASWCTENDVRSTVLRPTLIYDMRRDLNLARMARFVNRYRVLPIAFPASGLRQPIHADDVAKALLGAVDNPEAARGRMFNIAGGERLTYRAMAERVFAASGLQPRFLGLPMGAVRFAAAAAAGVGLGHRTSRIAAVFQRMNEDLVFDSEDGLHVLGYAPRAFDPMQR